MSTQKLKKQNLSLEKVTISNLEQIYGGKNNHGITDKPTLEGATCVCTGHETLYK